MENFNEAIEKQVKIFDDINAKLPVVVSSVDTVFREKTLLAIFAEVNKDLRMREINRSRVASPNNAANLASDKQKKFMDSLKIPYTASTTKKEASDLIAAKTA